MVAKPARMNQRPAEGREFFRARIRVCAVEGLVLPLGEGEGRVAAVEARWKKKKPPETKNSSSAAAAAGALWKLLSFCRRSGEMEEVESRRAVSGERPVGKDGTVEWAAGGNEFDAIFGSGDGAAAAMSFTVFFGLREEGSNQRKKKKKKKLQAIGTVDVNTAAWVLKLQGGGRDAEMARKLQIPITLKNGGLACNAILHISGSFVAVVEDPDRLPFRRNSVALSQLLRDEPAAAGEDDPDSSSSNASCSFSPDLTSSSNGDTHRRSSSSSSSAAAASSSEDPAKSNWEVKELISRDKKTKMRTKAFFASIDQRDESAGGESACTAIVAVIADTLLRSGGSGDLARPEFDELIRDGSSEWQSLCSNAAYVDRFPDKHFDLDTVLSAGVRPIAVSPGGSFVGFFRPESFESLCGAMSFEAIWEEIKIAATGDEEEEEEEQRRSSVFIISWNDHFFVLKVEEESYYILDTLGERLYEGCERAYILKFDESTELFETTKEGDGGGGEGEEPVCRGKECCREFISRFLAAIPVEEELEMEKKKGMETGDMSSALHQRLQIEFHLMITTEQQRERDRERASLMVN